MYDLISRQEAIDALLDRFSDEGCQNIEYFVYWDHGMVIDTLKKVPSAQPEIIRCKDCKYGHAHNPDGSIICEHWDDNAVNDDDFCSRAERGTDG